MSKKNAMRSCVEHDRGHMYLSADIVTEIHTETEKYGLVSEA